MQDLKGVVFDYACGLDQIILNREPREFEYLRLLVDGAHWQVGNILSHSLYYYSVIVRGKKS